MASFLIPVVAGIAAETGEIHFKVTDDRGDSLPCRIHVRDSSGAPVKVAGYPYWSDHFVCSGQATVSVAPDNYEWEIERGPEYLRKSGKVNVRSGEIVDATAMLTSIASLRDEGWYCGDLHVHRPVSQIEPLMLAEDLDFATVIGWWNSPAPKAVAAKQTEFQFGDDRIYCTGAGEDERAGGALLYFGLNKPLDLSVINREVPSPMRFVEQARQQNPEVWIDIEKSFWWDVPTWLAVAKPDSIGIAHNHMHRSGVLDNEAWGKQRSIEQFPGPHGNGLWTQEIYYHILNCGIRIPPSAGSASGVLPNPVGYNRAYVHLGDKPFHRDNWFTALKSGRCFVTNGPLLRVRANQTHAGTILRLDETRKIDFEIHLTSNDPFAEVQVIFNGSVQHRIPCRDARDQTLHASMELRESGWFLVRAIADVEHTFRFASTAPWYVEGENNSKRISRSSVEFFLDWLESRILNIQQNVSDISQRDLVLGWHYQAREFFRALQRDANAD
ncbi:MAG: CehA/McbA family metallohydrolase [Planctomycetaceae bacterium]